MKGWDLQHRVPAEFQTVRLLKGIFSPIGAVTEEASAADLIPGMSSRDT